ncbi:AraC family transcriptional regulator [Paenibacillus sp. GCM10023252]|uniref:helix-turn-helix transcriptional regulator n=1 Tax=Paenibacillus sp. GCM10023252 TaxID=3252649 RepID=UPI003619C1F1
MQRQSHLLTLTDSPFFCCPESVGIYQDEPNHAVTRGQGALNNFNIHYVASGKGYVEIDGVEYELEAGEAFLYFPLQQQKYYSSKSEPWDIRWVHFYGGTGLQEYMVDRGFMNHRLWTLRQSAGWERAHLALLEEAEEHKMLRPAVLSTLLYAVIAEFVSQAIPITGSKPSTAANRILDLLPLMQQEACKPFILEEWAERSGISVHYFCKLFRKAMQMTPMDFITRCRLQMAKQWLLDRRDANIGQIASDAGYPSSSYFNKRFLEHEGVTPTEYRRLYGK